MTTHYIPLDICLLLAGVLVFLWFDPFWLSLRFTGEQWVSFCANFSMVYLFILLPSLLLLQFRSFAAVLGWILGIVFSSLLKMVVKRVRARGIINK